MKHCVKAIVLAAVVSVGLSGGGYIHQTSVTFPDPDDIFITSGDGDIQKPYTPVGEFLYIEAGSRIGFFLLGYIKIKDVDPDVVLRTTLVQEIRAMGGDGLINMRISWRAPSNGFLGFGATGGSLAITGTVVRR